METATLVTFIVYLVGMLIIGLVAYKLTSNLSDYVLGGRSTGPAVTALSAGASDMSSWLLLGLPGLAYATGVSSIWMSVGLLIGAYVNWRIVAPRLRSYTEVADDAITIPDFLQSRFRDKSSLLRVVSALIILVFFTFYVSSGLVAGAILFQESFGLDYMQALLIGAIVIVSYTFLGGYLAVSWTDFVQGLLMFLALVVVPIVTIVELGGWSEVTSQVRAVDPGYFDPFYNMTTIGIISLAAWGLGYFGQPHIIVRFMGIKSVKQIPAARRIGMGWMAISMAGAVLVGFIGIAYFAGDPLIAGDMDNSEKVFILLSDVLFNPVVSGILLAAILSAIMSTIDSQLLVSSSALAEDLYPVVRPNASQKELVWIGRIGVLVIAIVAILLAMGAQNGETSVLDLVAYAWAGFGAAFGPAILLSLYWRGTNQWGILAGLVVGSLVVFTWVDVASAIWAPAAKLYEIVPGFILSLLAIIIVSKLTGRPGEDIQNDFDRAVAYDPDAKTE